MGSVVYLYAFDVAYDMSREPLEQLLGEPLAHFAVDESKRSPRQPFSYKPQMVRLPAQDRLGPHGPTRVEYAVKLLPVGAISITVRVPFQVDHIDDLVSYHDLRLNGVALADEVRRLAEKVLEELRPHLIRPVKELADKEAYTVFALEAPILTAEGVQQSAECWLEAHRRQTAALLTQEPDIGHLSKQEAEESTGRSLSYYDYDLVVIDWDAALIIDRRNQLDETLYIMELANLQLAELEAYDQILDDALDRASRDLKQHPLRSRGVILSELREIRIDLARFSDELSNITKFFGDWHLARIYANISARFHLADWHRTIDEKLKTLDDLYQILNYDRNNQWMMILEVTIVLLFVIDLVMLFIGMK